MKIKKLIGLSAIVGVAAVGLTACNQGGATTTTTSGAPATTTTTTSGAPATTTTTTSGAPVTTTTTGAAPATTTTTGAAPATTTTTQKVYPTSTEWTDENTTDENLYDFYFGEYEDELTLANNATNDNDRYYHMAKAEAVLYDQALILPVNTQGGRYTLTRIAVGSAPYALWGTDSDKLKNIVVATEFIKAADRATMKAKLLTERAAAAAYSHYSDGSHTTTYNAATELEALGYTTKRTFNTSITSFPKTLDLTNTYRAADAEIACNFTDYLVQYDVAGNIVPALAQSWTRSADGLKYTFNLRQGAKWVDSAGLEYGDVTAHDFEFGIKMAGENDMTSYMLGKIKNFNECYDSGDFSTLAVTAIDDYTLEIELEEPCDYFLTYLTYNTFTPVKEEYFNEKGANYGKDPQNILYCGAFICTEMTDKSTLKMARNTKYWDNEHTTLDQVIYSFEDGSNETDMYNKLKSGTYDGLSLSAARIQLAKADNLFDEYAYVSDTNATSYFGGFNLNRQAYINVREDVTSASTQTAEQKTLTHKALLNTNFRRAILAGLDKERYNVPVVGQDAALFSLRNLYVPYDYVTLTGAAGGYAAGTQYGDMVLAELQNKGAFDYVTDLHDGVNAYYNADKAKAFLAAAWTELNLTATDVVYIDYPVDNTNTVSVQQSNILKQILEEIFEGKVVINLVMHADYYTYLYSNYLVDYASEMNYDFDISSGWGPDHGDPSTYLDTFLPAGDMIRLDGINAHESTKTE